MKKTNWSLFLTLMTLNAITLSAVLFGFPAFAQATGLPVDDAAAMGLLKTLWGFFVAKQWGMVAGPAVALIVYGTKRFDQPFFTLIGLPGVAAKIDTFLNQPFVSFLLPTVIAALGGLGTAIATGQPFIEGLKTVFEASMAAVFTYVGIKKAAEQLSAGTAAAAAVDTKAKAVEELKKP